MKLLDRDICIRNHVLGVLALQCERGFEVSNMGELADSITEAVLDGDRKWQEEFLCDQFAGITGIIDEDVPQ